MRIQALTCSFMVSASAFRDRSTRSTGVTQSVESLKDAFDLLVGTYKDYNSHGCYCSAIAQGQPGIGSVYDNAADMDCRDWLNARKCLLLSGGACEGRASLPSYMRAEGVDGCDPGDYDNQGRHLVSTRDHSCPNFYFSLFTQIYENSESAKNDGLVPSHQRGGGTPPPIKAISGSALGVHS